MYPKVCPVCNQPEQYANRGFEHISMYLQGQGRGIVYLRCARCNKTFPWHYGEPEQVGGPAAAITDTKRNSHAKVNA